MKLKKLVRRLKQILDAVDTIQQRVNYINESSDELDKLISLVVASNKGYDIEELSKLIGNPCPSGGWEPCDAEWVYGDGWVRVRTDKTIQYFKLDKIDFNFFKE